MAATPDDQRAIKYFGLTTAWNRRGGPRGSGLAFSGSIVDLWWKPLEDIGPEGADKGKGGKYLVLPPGFKGKVPGGYIVLRSRTYRIKTLFRAVPADHGDAGWAAAVAYDRLDGCGQIRVHMLRIGSWSLI